MRRSIRLVVAALGTALAVAAAVTFEGVLLSDLLAVAGVPDSASKVSLTALADYKVQFKGPTCAARRCCWPPPSARPVGSLFEVG